MGCAAMIVRPFTKRHLDEIRSKTLIVSSLSGRLKNRVWRILQRHNEPFETDWFETTTLISVETKLKDIYGNDQLSVKQDGELVDVGFEEFVKRTYPSQVLDVIEVFYAQLDENNKDRFAFEINSAFEEEKCPWRLANGYFFKVDSDFLEKQVLARTEELLKAEGFTGALQEFTEARNDLVAADYKGAILNSAKSLESVLKTILNKDEGNASSLIRDLVDSSFFDDVPENTRSGMGNSVLMAVPFIRNKLAGHGQGDDVVNVPQHYADLSVNLSASLIFFLISKYLEHTPKQEANDEPKPEDVPF